MKAIDEWNEQSNGCADGKGPGHSLPSFHSTILFENENCDWKRREVKAIGPARRAFLPFLHQIKFMNWFDWKKREESEGERSGLLVGCVDWLGGLWAVAPPMAPPKKANSTTTNPIQREWKEWSKVRDEWNERMKFLNVARPACSWMSGMAHQRPPAGGKGSNHKPNFLSPAAREENWLVGWLLGLQRQRWFSKSTKPNQLFQSN